MSWLSSALGLDHLVNVEKGQLQKGLDWEAKVQKLTIKGIETMNLDILHDVQAIAQQWLKELSVEGSAVVSPQVINQIVHGADPFQTSRHMAETACAKWGIT